MVLHSIKYYLRKISLNPTSTTYTVRVNFIKNTYTVHRRICDLGTVYVGNGVNCKDSAALASSRVYVWDN